MHLPGRELHQIAGRGFEDISVHGDAEPALQEIEELLVVVIMRVGMAPASMRK